MSVSLVGTCGVTIICRHGSRTSRSGSASASHHVTRSPTVDETERLVRDPWRQMIVTPHVPTRETDTGYGYGWYVGPLAGFAAVYHPGDNNGFRAFCGWSARDRVRVVVLSNSEAVDPVDEALRLLAL